MSRFVAANDNEAVVLGSGDVFADLGIEVAPQRRIAAMAAFRHGVDFATVYEMMFPLNEPHPALATSSKA